MDQTAGQTQVACVSVYTHKDFCRVQSCAGSREGLWIRRQVRLRLPVSVCILMLKDHMHVKDPVLHERKHPKTGAVWSPNLFFITL